MTEQENEALKIADAMVGHYEINLLGDPAPEELTIQKIRAAILILAKALRAERDEALRILTGNMGVHAKEIDRFILEAQQLRAKLKAAESILALSEHFLNTLKIAWGHFYPGEMTEAWELDKALEKYAQEKK